MTREEEANKASISYVSQMCDLCLDEYCKEVGLICPQFTEYRGAFIEGIKWADEHPKNVWHNSSEHPLEDGAILYQTTLGQFRTVCDGKCGEGAWKVFTIDQDVSRWAYIKDLLPK